jgi:branched-chain amino acid transport system substrate-binding protein
VGFKVVRTGLVIAGLTALAAGATACGDSSSDAQSAKTPPTTATSATTSTAALSGAPIRLGSVCSCTGPQASSLAAAGDAIKAWAQQVNQNGGVNGHPVKLFFEDDASDPAKSRQAVTRLVEQDKVVAIVSDYSLQDEQWAKYVTEKGIPVVGGLTVEVPFLSNANFYATGGQPVIETLGFARLMDQLQKHSMRVFYCAESPICALAVKLAQLSVTAAGSSAKVSGAKISSTAPDFTAACLDAKNAGVDTIMLGVNALVAPRILKSCLRQGYKPTVLATAEGTGASLLKDSTFEGTVISGPVASHQDPVPGAKEFSDAMQAYKPGFLDSSSMSINAVEAWAAGKLFEAGAKAAELGPSSTPADVKRGLAALKDESLGDLVAPITYTKGKPWVTPCAYLHQVKGGKLELMGGKPSCATPAQLGKLLGSLSALQG